MYRILSKRNFLNVSDLAKLASAVSAFFGLEVIVEDADFDPSTTSADLRVITPNGKTVAYYGASLHTGNKYWSLNTETFATWKSMAELNELRKKERKQ